MMRFSDTSKGVVGIKFKRTTTRLPAVCEAFLIYAVTAFTFIFLPHLLAVGQVTTEQATAQALNTSTSPLEKAAYDGRAYGDFDNNHLVNLLDFNILVNAWGNPYKLIDFNNLVNHWQQQVSAGEGEGEGEWEKILGPKLLATYCNGMHWGIYNADVELGQEGKPSAQSASLISSIEPIESLFQVGGPSKASLQYESSNGEPTADERAAYVMLMLANDRVNQAKTLLEAMAWCYKNPHNTPEEVEKCVQDFKSQAAAVLTEANQLRAKAALLLNQLTPAAINISDFLIQYQQAYSNYQRSMSSNFSRNAQSVMIHGKIHEYRKSQAALLVSARGNQGPKEFTRSSIGMTLLSKNMISRLAANRCPNPEKAEEKSLDSFAAGKSDEEAGMPCAVFSSTDYSQDILDYGTDAGAKTTITDYLKGYCDSLGISNTADVIQAYYLGICDGYAFEKSLKTQ